MTKFLEYNPEQAYLLPPNVREVLSDGHLCFFVHQAVERLDLRPFVAAYAEDGRPAYHPALLLKVWLYAYALDLTSSRRLEQRIREDLAFRYLAAGQAPDFWTLAQFRRRHSRAINDAFTQVLELARGAGLARLGHVAVDSTRVAANASLRRVDSPTVLRHERARLRRQIRRWQQRCDSEDPNEAPGLELAESERAALEQELAAIPARLERLRKAGVGRLSRTDPQSRFLRGPKGFTLGYTVDLAVSEDHLIVAQRVTTAAADNASLLPLVEAVEQNCGERPARVLADAGFFSLENLEQLEQRGIDAYVPDAHLARELNWGVRVRGHAAARRPVQVRMRRKLRDPIGRRIYARRKSTAEPVIGTLKQQRGLRQFRCRGRTRVAAELALACIASNLVHLYHTGLRWG